MLIPIRIARNDQNTLFIFLFTYKASVKIQNNGMFTFSQYQSKTN